MREDQTVSFKRDTLQNSSREEKKSSKSVKCEKGCVMEELSSQPLHQGEEEEAQMDRNQERVLLTFEAERGKLREVQ